MEETQKPSKKHGTVPLVFVFIFVTVYFLFPVIFEYPLYKYYETKLPPWADRALWFFYYPERKVMAHSAGYYEMVTKERAMLGI